MPRHRVPVANVTSSDDERSLSSERSGSSSSSEGGSNPSDSKGIRPADEGEAGEGDAGEGTAEEAFERLLEEAVERNIKKGTCTKAFYNIIACQRCMDHIVDGTNTHCQRIQLPAGSSKKTLGCSACQLVCQHCSKPKGLDLFGWDNHNKIIKTPCDACTAVIGKRNRVSCRHPHASADAALVCKLACLQLTPFLHPCRS